MSNPKIPEPVGVGCGPAPPLGSSERDIVDLIYAEGKRLFEHGDKISPEDVRVLGSRIKFLCTHLHGKLARR